MCGVLTSFPVGMHDNKKIKKKKQTRCHSGREGFDLLCVTSGESEIKVS